MKLEVTEKEARKLLSERWCDKHWREGYLPMGLLFILMLLYVVIIATVFRHLPNWVALSPAGALMLVLFYVQYWFFTKARKETSEEFEKARKG